jgi:hypothetical protein
LARRWARKKLAERYNIGVGGFVEPFAVLNELLPKIP